MIAVLAHSCVTVGTSTLPVGSNMFFDNWLHPEPLPSPSQIRSSTYQYTPRILSSSHRGYFYQTVCHYEELGLIVKYGKRTTVAEGQALWLIHKYSPAASRYIPTVYGWITEGEEVFIYLSYIPGDTLDSRMSGLGKHDLDRIAQQLQSIVLSWRTLRLPVDDVFIGAPDRKPIRDQLWWHQGRDQMRSWSSAFRSVAEFNDAFHALGNGLPNYEEAEYYRSIRTAFPDLCEVCLTHTDLAPVNIILSPTSMEVVGIIDWQESGWYPESWEYIKLRYYGLDKWGDAIEPYFGTTYEEQWEGFSKLVMTGIF